MSQKDCGLTIEIPVEIISALKEYFALTICEGGTRRHELHEILAKFCKEKL